MAAIPTCCCPPPGCDVVQCGVWSVKLALYTPWFNRHVWQLRGAFDCLRLSGGHYLPQQAGAARPSVARSWGKAMGTVRRCEGGSYLIYDDASAVVGCTGCSGTDWVTSAAWSGVGLRKSASSGLWEFLYQRSPDGLTVAFPPGTGNYEILDQERCTWVARCVSTDPQDRYLCAPWWSQWVVSSSLTLLETCPATEAEWNAALEANAPLDTSVPAVVAEHRIRGPMTTPDCACGNPPAPPPPPDPPEDPTSYCYLLWQAQCVGPDMWATYPAARWCWTNAEYIAGGEPQLGLWFQPDPTGQPLVWQVYVKQGVCAGGCMELPPSSYHPSVSCP